jgi:quercetin dioxygenase-like cupin family protein
VSSAVFAERTSKNEFPYDIFMRQEGLPVHRGLIGIEDVTQLVRAPWGRTGGNGAFIELQGTFQSERGVYVADIPGGGELKPEKHLYEEEIFILEGNGVAQIWQTGGMKQTFEWGKGSVFAIPPNTTHALLNAGREPAVYLGVTTAPRVINSLPDIDVVFASDYQFVDLQESGSGYFKTPEIHSVTGWYKQGMLDTHLIADARALVLDGLEQKVAGGQLTGYRMGSRFPRGHVSSWPAGRYHKAHYHGPGALLLGLDGDGYVLAWDATLGARPYQDGNGHLVERVEWKANSIYSPPDGYFHQHFNTSPTLARHVAVYGEILPLGVHGLNDEDGWRGHQSFRDGGTLIEYEDEDPQVRADFKATIEARGIALAMADVTYRDR